MIRTLTDTIKEPFWSAGQKYGWEGSRTGIGLNVRHFETLGDQDTLRVNITLSKRECPYQIRVGKIRSLAKVYQSYFVARDNTKLVIIPLHEFESLEGPMPIKPPESLPKEKQPSLF